MSIASINFYADSLGQRADLHVVLPEYPAQRAPSGPYRTVYDRARRFPVVYLLNGYTGDYTDWLTMLPLERFVTESGIAAVIPSGANTWYEDIRGGMQMRTFITEELPAAAEAFFPLADTADRRFIAGISMGGRGAAMLSAACPDIYRAAACLSAPLLFGQIAAAAGCTGAAQQRLCDSLAAAQGGRDAEALEYPALVAAQRRRGLTPPETLYLMGENDPFFASQYPPLQRLAAAGELPLQMHSYPGQQHDFAFWQPAAQEMFRWLGERLPSVT